MMKLKTRMEYVMEVLQEEEYLLRKQEIHLKMFYLLIAVIWKQVNIKKRKIYINIYLPKYIIGGINLESTKGSFVHEMYDLLQYDFVNLGPRDFDDGEDTIGNLTKPGKFLKYNDFIVSFEDLFNEFLF